MLFSNNQRMVVRYHIAIIEYHIGSFFTYYINIINKNIHPTHKVTIP